MINKNNPPVSEGKNISQMAYSCCGNDEIDLRDLISALWKGKLIVLLTTLTVAVLVGLYSFFTPNLYQSQASFVLNKSFYELDNNYNLSVDPKMITSSAVKKMLVENINSELNSIRGISIDYDRRNSIFIVSNLASSSDDAYRGVLLILKELNPVLKYAELSRINMVTASLESLVKNELHANTQDALYNIYAQQLYKKAILENPTSELIFIVNQPVKPLSHIKPNRFIITIIGCLLGAMIGFFIVIIMYVRCKSEVK